MPRPGPFSEPSEAARAASLRYVSDAAPGIRRLTSGRGFRYVGVDGRPVRDPATLARVRGLAIPPAWREVWICPTGEGHLQATGRDARHRKQYRYHPRWRAIRDETKFERMLLFGAALPKIRARVRRDLALPGLPRDKVLATVVRLLETSLIRVGNEEYVRANQSFGLTTLRNRHVTIEGGSLRFRFQGKSGKVHTVDVNDRRLARLVEQCRELPGQDLFQYLDDEGQPQPIDSGAVNEYLGTLAGKEFTAKDFRTWAGTVLAARLLGRGNGDADGGEDRPGIGEVAKAVADQLGNTAAITRKCYIHPAVLGAHQNPRLLQVWQAAAAGPGARRGLDREETAVLRFLRACSRRSLASLLEDSLRGLGVRPRRSSVGAARSRGKGR